jgi:hypothetical protein
MDLDIILFVAFTQERVTIPKLTRFAARLWKVLKHDFVNLPREDLSEYCRARLKRAGMDYDIIDRLSENKQLRTEWANADFRGMGARHNPRR